jgi:hypothetical protein
MLTYGTGKWLSSYSNDMTLTHDIAVSPVERIAGKARSQLVDPVVIWHQQKPWKITWFFRWPSGNRASAE